MNNTFKIQITREVKMPVRGHAKDAGIDFFIPTDLIAFDFKGYKYTSGFNLNYETGFIEEIVINPHCDILIPAGIKMVVPDNHGLIFFNKSGVATKKYLTVGAGVIDQDYRGEVHIHLINTSERYITIRAGDKIVQGIILPINYATPEIVEDINAVSEPTDRGAGGFGSTGTK